MFKSLKTSLFLILSIIIFQACSKGPLKGDMASNMAKLDQLHGACKNPHRILSPRERMLCEDKQRAAGPGGNVEPPLSLSKLAAGLKGGGSTTIVQGLTVNQSLWQASLGLLDQYPIKLVDSQGGFISTEWIANSSSPNQRCNIKVTITSKDLVSDGVKVKLLCENNIDGSWFTDNTAYVNEEKDLTLKILELANQIAKTNQAS
jgi:hypothetical protein